MFLMDKVTHTFCLHPEKVFVCIAVHIIDVISMLMTTCNVCLLNSSGNSQKSSS
uniref:Uncharacterized protein n=1 Tax=Arion vulgaris TaxID=1028688 RepID=A0A0B7AV83_9EUPU